MRRIIVSGLVSLAVLTLLSGCSWRDVRDVAVNSAMPPGTAQVMRDVARTAADIEAEERAERVEELSSEYEEFLRESGGDADEEPGQQRSVILADPRDRHSAVEHRRHRHVEELTSEHSEHLNRRNGIESEPARHQPDVVPDPNR